MKNNQNFYKLLFFLVILSSCTSIRKEESTPKLLRLTDLNTGLYRIEANCGMNSSMNGQSLSFRAKVLVSGEDSCAMTLNGPLGITIGRLFADSKYFQFHNIIQNVIYTGTPSAENIKKATGMSISIKDILNLFRGRTPYPATDYTYFQTKSDSNLVFKRVDNSKFADFAVVSYVDNRILQYQRKDQDNILLVNSVYDDFRSYDNFLLPTSMNFAIPSVEGKLIINVDDYKVNSKANLPSKFQIPSSVKIINLDN